MYIDLDSEQAISLNSLNSLFYYSSGSTPRETYAFHSIHIAKCQERSNEHIELHNLFVLLKSNERYAKNVSYLIWLFGSICSLFQGFGLLFLFSFLFISKCTTHFRNYFRVCFCILNTLFSQNKISQKQYFAVSSRII